MKFMRNAINSIIEYAKNSTLPKEEKTLREAGLKDECGQYTKEAREIVIDHLVEQNKEMLVKLAEEAKKEAKKEAN